MRSGLIQRYTTLMSRTRVLSQTGAFLALVLALLEGGNVIRGVQLAENLSREAVISASIPPITFALGFGFRFICLLRWTASTTIGPLSWWVAFSCVALSVLTSFGWFELSGYSKYHPYSMSALEWTGSLFVMFSIVRFSATLLLAFSSNNELDSHS